MRTYSGEGVRVIAGEEGHSEARLNNPALEDSQEEIGEFAIVALLETITKAIEGEAAAGWSEEVHGAREPCAECGIDWVGAEPCDCVAQAGCGKGLIPGSLFENQIGGARMRGVARFAIVDPEHQVASQAEANRAHHQVERTVGVFGEIA